MVKVHLHNVSIILASGCSFTVSSFFLTHFPTPIPSCPLKTCLLNILRMIFGQDFSLLQIIFPLFLSRLSRNKDWLLDEICLVYLGMVSKEVWLRKRNDYIKAYKRPQSYCYPSFYFYAQGDSLVSTGSSVNAERSHITKSCISIWDLLHGFSFPFYPSAKKDTFEPSRMMNSVWDCFFSHTAVISSWLF